MSKSARLITVCALLSVMSMPARANSTRGIEYRRHPLPDINVTNPVGPVVELQFSLKQGGPVNLSLYDVAGRMVSKLVDGPMAAGSHVVQWNRGASRSGVYFARLRSGEETQTVKLLVVNR